MDHPIPETVFRECTEPGEPLPELPDDAYGDDAVVLDEYEDDKYLD